MGNPGRYGDEEDHRMIDEFVVESEQ